MRWRLTLLVAATTSAVVLAFLIPLTLLLRSLAEERTLATVTADATNLVQIAANSGAAGAQKELDAAEADPLGTVSVYLPDKDILGAQVPADDNVAKATGGLAFTVREDGHAVVYVPALTTEGAYVVRTEVSGSELHRGVGRASWILGALGTLLLALSVGAADTLARRLSDPIKDLAAAADSIRDGRLDIRSPEHGPPEVAAMAGALNRLSARIEQLLISERESVADLSHRLRTPVTALRLDVESITDPELAQRIEEHVATLERTVSAVVQDARRPVKANVTSRCDVAALVGERVAFWSALADEQGRSLRTWLPSRPTWARIDSVELTDVVDVLIDNVFAHTDEGVPLEVTVNTNAAHEIVLAVQDGGPGLPGADVVARGHSNAGSSGLGLDIVRRAAIASGGRLELGRSRLGGAKVQVVLSPAETRTRERMRQRRNSAGGGLGKRIRKLAGIGS